eukprot:scaffold56583_cov28-Tisochrysis_lutea.AAC.2
MGDFHYIVDKLNQPPFNCNLSLLSFSEETPQQLLQLVSDVFTQISPKHQKVDVSREDPDAMVDRLTNFLKIIKYKPNYDPMFMQALKYELSFWIDNDCGHVPSLVILSLDEELAHIVHVARCRDQQTRKAGESTQHCNVITSRLLKAASKCIKRVPCACNLGLNSLGPFPHSLHASHK